MRSACDFTGHSSDDQDIGIATFLMLLWKHMYATENSSQDDQSLENEPWRTWPCPSAGFVDLGYAFSCWKFDKTCAYYTSKLW